MPIAAAFYEYLATNQTVLLGLFVRRADALGLFLVYARASRECDDVCAHDAAITEARRACGFPTPVQRAMSWPQRAAGVTPCDGDAAVTEARERVREFDRSRSIDRAARRRRRRSSRAPPRVSLVVARAAEQKEGVGHPFFFSSSFFFFFFFLTVATCHAAISAAASLCVRP